MTDTADAPTTEAPTGVPVTIDGREIVAREGELIIDAAERNGIYIPRFCYHPRMKPVGMCRMCIVEVDAGRGATLQPTCMLECTPGMVVNTESEVTKKAQDGVLEFLLINHPLDCPVCDKGGECPLQDQTMAYGPGESRFVEEKRHHEKPIPISDLVFLDRERCILCDRCTRFAKDVAGDTLIHFLHRGNETEINTFPDHPFSSYFSGNTVQICPVGALTASSYRFKARPWDLEETESTCQSCSVGCRVAVQSSRDEVLRYIGVDIDPVNWGWLCDKGRFSFEAVQSEDRLRDPLVRRGGGFVPTRWSDALDEAAEAIQAGLDRSGPAGLGVLGGSQLTNEGAYAWAKLAKGLLGTDNVDAQLGDGLVADAVLGLPRATIDQLCEPRGTVILLGPDLKEELPVLFLRLRHAVLEDGVTVIDVAPHVGNHTELAAVSLHARPGEQAEVAKVLVGAIGTDKEVAGVAPERLAAARALVQAADGPITVLVGRQTLTESGDATAAAAGVLAEALPDARFLSGLRRANVHGALDMGLAPGLLPGRVRLADGEAWFATSWPTLPASTGLDAAGMLRAAADGKLDTLVLLGADPLADFPDHQLAVEALANVRTVIAVDQFLTASAEAASVVLPAAGFAEVSGTTTNIEGRVSRMHQRVTAPGSCQPDWIVAADLAAKLGHDLGLTSVEAITDEIAALAPAYLGVTNAVVDHPDARAGIVVPLATEATATDLEDAPGQADASTDGDVAPATGDGEEAGDVEVASEPDAPAVPPLVTLAPSGADATPPVDSYSLRLAATRRLYDLGVKVQRSPALAGLTPGTVLRVNRYDFDRLGVDEGSQVRVKSTRGSISVELRVDDGVPRGTAAIYANQPGVVVGELVDAAQRVTEVRIERGDA